MKQEYEFSNARRGPVLGGPGGKARITIRLDDDVLEWFRDEAHAAGGGSYQTMINAALREFIEGRRERLEDTLRRVIQEELRGESPGQETNPSATEPRDGR